MLPIKWKTPTCPKDVECKVVEMSPLDFLAKVPSPCREGYTALEDLNLPDCWSQTSINYIMDQVKKGTELEPPILDYTRMFRGFPTHEGRHHAYVAYKLGYDRIPVLVIGKMMMSSEENYSELERIVVEEYSRIIDKATEKYGLKYRCKLCGEVVEYRTEHLMQKHPEIKFPQMLVTLLEYFDTIKPPKVYIPKLHEEQWKKELMPPQDTAKFYGTVYYPPEGPFFVINTWALTREMEVFGIDHVRAKVKETLCHELVHFFRQDMSELEVNIEAEKLLRTL
jgi:hypothetical protein